MVWLVFLIILKLYKCYLSRICFENVTDLGFVICAKIQNCVLLWKWYGLKKKKKERPPTEINNSICRGSHALKNAGNIFSIGICTRHRRSGKIFDFNICAHTWHSVSYGPWARFRTCWTWNVAIEFLSLNELCTVILFDIFEKIQRDFLIIEIVIPN